ncbi:MAG: DeoR/GlpR transcriptional regulator [Ectothiorhodospiraceae bacterium]|nr:DeoR/GlpR transcriptional regulator [Chromatiales bacterium]MCP5153621.1 DeoR/GlpR transcriptional regulator [Ectothiorhodospiraceae bacterium]
MREEPHLSGVRRRKIAQIVQQRGSAAVRDLCRQFGMSEATIRRDLRELDELGVVTRTRGGVMKNGPVVPDLPNEQRKQVGCEEKRRIGLAAIELLSGDEVVFLDAGTTALAVAENASRKPGCRYVTTCLGVARLLREQEIPGFFMIGGSYQRVNDAFAGTLAISALRSLSFDVSFLCCSAVDVARRSIAIGDEPYSQVQREVAAVTRRNIVVAHSDKFAANAFIRTVRFEDLDTIVTDRDLNGATAARIRDAGLEVVLA